MESLSFKEMTLRLPVGMDSNPFWAFVHAMGWTKYVVAEPEKAKPTGDFFAEFRNLPPDNTPIEDIREDMYREKYGF